MAAIGFSRYRAGSDRLAIAILAVRAVPPITLAIPALFLFTSVGLRDTYIGVILVHTAFAVPFSFWMLKSFIDEVPPAIEEAGMMDGMSRLRAHLVITVPMIRGGMMVTGLFIFILTWNEFLLTMTLSDKVVVTVPLYLHHHTGVYGQAALAAAAARPLRLSDSEAPRPRVHPRRDQAVNILGVQPSAASTSSRIVSKIPMASAICAASIQSGGPIRRPLRQVLASSPCSTSRRLMRSLTAAWLGAVEKGASVAGSAVSSIDASRPSERTSETLGWRALRSSRPCASTLPIRAAFSISPSFS